MESLLMYITPGTAVVALLAAYALFLRTMRSNPGDFLMIETADFVRQAVLAHIAERNRVSNRVMAAAAFLLVLVSAAGLASPLVPAAFLTGGFLSGLAGILSAKFSVAASTRIAQAARSKVTAAVAMARSAAAVPVLIASGFALLESSAWLAIVRKIHGPMPSGLALVQACLPALACGSALRAFLARGGANFWAASLKVATNAHPADLPAADARNPLVVSRIAATVVRGSACRAMDLHASITAVFYSAAALSAVASRDGDPRQIFLLAVASAAAGIAIALVALFASTPPLVASEIIDLSGQSEATRGAVMTCEKDLASRSRLHGLVQIAAAAAVVLALLVAYPVALRGAALADAASHPDTPVVIGSASSGQPYIFRMIAYLSPADILHLHGVRISSPGLIIGLFTGLVLAYALPALMQSSHVAAAGIITAEAARQWNEIPGLSAGKKGVSADHAEQARVGTRALLGRAALFGAAGLAAAPVIHAVLGVGGCLGLIAGFPAAAVIGARKQESCAEMRLAFSRLAATAALATAGLAFHLPALMN